MGPQPADEECQQAGREEKRDQGDQCPRDVPDDHADRSDHHHVRAGGELTQAVEMQQFRKGQPVVGIDRELLHFWEGGHAAADGEEG